MVVGMHVLISRIAFKIRFTPKIGTKNVLAFPRTKMMITLGILDCYWEMDIIKSA